MKENRYSISADLAKGNDYYGKTFFYNGKVVLQQIVRGKRQKLCCMRIYHKNNPCSDLYKKEAQL